MVDIVGKACAAGWLDAEPHGRAGISLELNREVPCGTFAQRYGRRNRSERNHDLPCFMPRNLDHEIATAGDGLA